MSRSDVRRRRGERKPIELDDLDPREGLRRFSFAWFTRPPPAPEVVEVVEVVEVAEAPSQDGAAIAAGATDATDASAPVASSEDPVAPSAPVASSEGPIAPSAAGKQEAPKRRRASRRESGPELRRRAFSWLTRAPWRPVVEAPSRRKRAAKAEGGAELWLRSFAWLNRTAAPTADAQGGSAAAAPQAAPSPGLPRSPARRKRGAAAAAKREVEPDLWRRAFLWFKDLAEPAPAPDKTVVRLPGAVQLTDVARAHLRGVLEALVFASEHPMPAKELARIARAEVRVVKVLLGELVTEYASRGFRLDEVAGGFVFRTSPAFAPFVREQVAKKPVKMSRAQIETLAIVAYRQPITRPEIDEVRGVDSGAVLKSLLERDLVRILGKKDEPGRPMLYGTTADFLEFFGLKQLGDLPTLREFTELSDESRRTYERELGEEPPIDFSAPLPPPAEGLMGGEGAMRDPREFEFDPTLDGEAQGAGATAEAGAGVDAEAGAGADAEEAPGAKGGGGRDVDEDEHAEKEERHAPEEPEDAKGEEPSEDARDEEPSEDAVDEGADEGEANEGEDEDEDEDEDDEDDEDDDDDDDEDDEDDEDEDEDDEDEDEDEDDEDEDDE